VYVLQMRELRRDSHLRRLILARSHCLVRFLFQCG
jgi:hypothetical protein